MTRRPHQLSHFFFLSCAGLLAGLALAPACSDATDDTPGGSGLSGSGGTSGAGGSSAGSGGSSDTGGSGGNGDSGSGGSGDSGSGGNGTGGSGGGSGGSGGSGDAGGGGVGGGGPTQCTNGIDDDGDGTIDGMDPECTGAADDNESDFSTGIPGDNQDPKWQDCFFDGDSGAGNDGCRYHTGCLTGELPPDHEDCEITQECLEYCLDRTPNGCDCFGCCEITMEDGSTVNVWLKGTCSIEDVEDETLCPRCTQDDDCDNDCGRCELCPGKTDIPDDCNDDPDGGGNGGNGGSGGSGGNGGGGGNGGSGGDGHTCDGGQPVCDTQADCPTNTYCQLGCCYPIG